MGQRTPAIACGRVKSAIQLAYPFVSALQGPQIVGDPIRSLRLPLHTAALPMASYPSGRVWARSVHPSSIAPRRVSVHKSKLAGFIIDCNTQNVQSAANFWSGALGMEPRALPGVEGEKYMQLVDPSNRLHVEVQSVSHPSRVHLDIESDDVEAEVRRLEALGAKRIQYVQTWWVMEAPTGQRFCVVRAKPGALNEDGNCWD